MTPSAFCYSRYKAGCAAGDGSARPSTRRHNSILSAPQTFRSTNWRRRSIRISSTASPICRLNCRLRDCPADLQADWGRVWREIGFPGDPPWSPTLERAAPEARLPRNIRDLQRLAAIIVSTRPDGPWNVSLQRQALEEWRAVGAPPAKMQIGTRKQRLHWFQTRLALWAKERYGTWEAAASELACNESTLRVNAMRKANFLLKINEVTNLKG